MDSFLLSSTVRRKLTKKKWPNQKLEISEIHKQNFPGILRNITVDLNKGQECSINSENCLKTSLPLKGDLLVNLDSFLL